MVSSRMCSKPFSKRDSFASITRFVPLAAACFLTACGDSSSCQPIVSLFDPSGQWTGTLVQQESDCSSQVSRGAQFTFSHDVSFGCDSQDEPKLYLFNEDGLNFSQTSFSALGGGSFAVQSQGDNLTIDITYDNADGSLADVTERIRVYSNGRILCSEKYTGQARR